MRVNIEDIKMLQAELARINKMDLKEITFYEDEEGEPVEIDPTVIESFEFTGLSNIDFITTGYYLSGLKQVLKEDTKEVLERCLPQAKDCDAIPKGEECTHYDKGKCV